MDDEPEPDDDGTPRLAAGREPGWYRHSSRAGGHRYWNGREWVDHASDV